MRPQCGYFPSRQLKHKVGRKSCKVSLHLFVKSFGRYAVEGRQVAIEKNVLMSEDQNRLRNRIYAQRSSCIDSRCHMEPMNESNQSHCQPGMMDDQSQNTGWLPRYGCIASIVESNGRNRHAGASSSFQHGLWALRSPACNQGAIDHMFCHQARIGWRWLA